MGANSIIKTLYLIGPSSTGKSTLFRAIMEDMRLDPRQCITEVARTVMKNTNFSKKTIGNIEMQQTILKAQLARELEARSVVSSSAAGIVLSDRSAIDPVAYAVLTAPNKEDARHRMRFLVDTPEFQTALRWYREGTFILFKLVPDWLVDDGIRNMNEEGQCLEVFRGILRELKIPFVELGEEIKDLQARVTFAKGLINADDSEDDETLEPGLVCDHLIV